MPLTDSYRPGPWDCAVERNRTGLEADTPTDPPPDSSIRSYWRNRVSGSLSCLQMVSVASYDVVPASTRASMNGSATRLVGAARTLPGVVTVLRPVPIPSLSTASSNDKGSARHSLRIRSAIGMPSSAGFCTPTLCFTDKRFRCLASSPDPQPGRICQTLPVWMD